MKPLDIVAIVGSLRRDSFTRRLVQAMQLIAPVSLSFDLLPVQSFKLYNEVEETGSPPKPWTDFRERVRRADAVLFATPEYNRSVPGVLKNAVDIGSRPYGRSVWSRKPAAVLSTSPGALGAFGANHHLRQCLVFLDMPTLQQPECYMGAVDTLLNEAGRIVLPSAQDHLINFMRQFEAWIRQQTDSLRSSQQTDSANSLEHTV
jgi:chromate reductase